MDELFHKKYDRKQYHCVHFVIDAAKAIYSKDYSHFFVGLTGSIDEAINTSRQNLIELKSSGKPSEGCIVLMTYQDSSSHVGLYYKGRVFHLTENGVSRPTLEQIKPLFKRIRFYEPYTDH